MNGKRKTAHEGLFYALRGFMRTDAAMALEGENNRLAAHSILPVFHTGHLGSPKTVAKLFSNQRIYSMNRE